MRSLLAFIACLILVVSGLSSVAHATEMPGDAAVSALELATSHSPGDADEVPADSDRGYPHHHSICHGHDLAAPLKMPAAPQRFRDHAATHPALANALIDRTLDAPHRPPMA
jgi:hypothetical protein